MGGNDTPNIPKAPSIGNFGVGGKSGMGGLYQQGIQLSKLFTPEMLGREQGYREAYDPRRVMEQQGLQESFGPKQYQQMLEAYRTLDPQGDYARRVLGFREGSDVRSLGRFRPGDYTPDKPFDWGKYDPGKFNGNIGYDLPPDLARNLSQDFRGGQAARGNILGNAAAGAENTFLGQNRVNLQGQRYGQAVQTYQEALNRGQSAMGAYGLNLQRGAQAFGQRQGVLGNAQGFLSGPSPVSEMGAIPPISPDRSFAYENPNAGWQMVNAGMQQYQAQLGAAAAGQPTGGNPWMSALGSVGSIAGAVAPYAMSAFG